MNNYGMKNKPYTREWMLFNSTLFYLTKMPSNFCHSALNHQQSKKFVKGSLPSVWLFWPRTTVTDGQKITKLF